MAAGSSDYTHGEMDVKAQSGTFGGFMGLTKYGGAAIVLILLLPTLVFAANMAWFPSLIATAVLGIVIGVALKFKAVWYVALIASAVLVGLACLILTALIG